ncbi:MAG: dihydrofolate reductase [Alphaproteobacteria bacterium]|nr:dihydrofolate reductase [Alphaproteobacteria bacterium]
MARNRVIGRDGGLPWHIPADLRQFKALTMGKPMIMGRKTFASIGRPLPGRTNIVVTRSTGFRADGIVVAHDLEAACRTAQEIALEDGVDEIMVIGGAEIYALALPLTDRLYLTEVQSDVVGDVRFPAFGRACWRESARQSYEPQGEAPGFDFVVFDRNGPAGQ